MLPGPTGADGETLTTTQARGRRGGVGSRRRRAAAFMSPTHGPVTLRRMSEDLTALAADAVAASTTRTDPDYPLVHLAPPVGRLNDPNGLLVDGATYHAFYQLSPFHPHRKLVYWGHATSTDLLTWTQHEPAIVPDSSYDRSGAYSGTAVVLEGDEVDAAPAGAPYQLFYTGNVKEPVTDHRTPSQCLVTSPDLVSFDKWPGNPLVPDHLPGYTPHFRDPQVWRNSERPGEYRMLVGAQREDLTGAAVLLRSRDLLRWEPDGELSFPDAAGAMDALGYMWECPSIVRLTDEADGADYDVLVFCPQGIEPAGEGFENVFPACYAVGHLDGTQLRGCDGTVREIDRGLEFYAPQVLARRPSEPGPALLMAWAGNAGEDDQPSIAGGGWVHCLTAPRTLSLRAGRLVQRLAVGIPEDAPALGLEGVVPGAEPAPVPELEGHRSWQLVLELALSADRPRAAAGGPVRLALRIGSPQCHVDITLELGEEPAVVVDRSTSRYAQHGALRRVSLPAGTAPRIEVLHDRSITEVVVGDGDVALTMRSFIDPASSGVLISGDGATRVASARAVAHDAPRIG